MRIGSFNVNKSLDIKDKSIAARSNFTDDFMKSYKSATKEELEQYIKDIKRKGSRLIITKTYNDVKNYKETIKSYLKAVVDYTYTLNKKTSFWESHYYSTVETINEKLEDLTKEVLKEEKENLNLSSTIDNIQGLLVDIYK